MNACGLGRAGWVAALMLTIGGATAGETDYVRTVQGSPGYTTELALSGGYVLEVDGKADAKARFYEGEPPVQVIVFSGDGVGYVLDRATQSVRKLLRNLATEQPGSLRMLPGASGDLLPGGYQADGPGVRFRDAAHAFYVVPKPPLIGEVTLENILQHSPEYRIAMDQYFPSQAAVAILRACAPTARIEVFYGSWCPFCRRHLPRLLKALELAKGSPLGVRLVALPKGFAQEKAAADRGVQRVPTLIAYDGLREVGRLQGSDWERPEEALVRLLPARAPAPAAN